MRKSLAVVVFVVALLSAGTGSAATFEFQATRQRDGLTWNFSLFSPNLPVAAIGITVPATVTGFSIDPPNRVVRRGHRLRDLRGAVVHRAPHARSARRLVASQ
jgi:hypothetical protein